MSLLSEFESAITEFQTQFSAESSVWIYQSDLSLSKVQCHRTEYVVQELVQNWKSHGKPVKGQFALLGKRILILVADASEHPSGCSIDSTVRVLKELGAELGVDWMNRLKIAAIDIQANNLVVYPLASWKSKIKQGDFQDGYVESLIVIQNTVQTVCQLNSWLTPFSHSLINPYLTTH